MKHEIKQRIEQIKAGQVPDGYKRTKIGAIPTEWDVKKLSAISSRAIKKNLSKEIQTTYTNSATQGVIKQTDYFDKEISNRDNISSYYVVEENDYIYNPRISTSAPCGPINKSHFKEKGIVSPLYTVFRMNQGLQKNRYIEFYFKSAIWHRYMCGVANYGARHDRMNITNDDLFGMPIVFPSIAEQEKIADILSAQDSVIELKEKLLEEKKKHKKYLMQQILNDKTVRTKFSSHWETVELQDIFEYIQPTKYLVESTDYSKMYHTPVLTAGKSFILGYTNETKGIYEQVPVVIFDDFTTDSKYVDFPFKVKSSAMKILKAKDNYDIRFAFELLQNINYIVGGHERHWISIFSQFTVDVPPYEVQLKISNIIQMADKEIELFQKELDQEKQKKKALMQLLLTGIVRVEVNK